MALYWQHRGNSQALQTSQVDFCACPRPLASCAQAAAFVKCFAPLAQHVEATEPGTLTYKLAFDAEDPDAFIM
jgi:hypothetical protein